MRKEHEKFSNKYIIKKIELRVSIKGVDSLVYIKYYIQIGLNNKLFTFC